eukprot:GAFH01006384.1.p2 GENE.GAFH01006384.1~~GAFH01006384.1.p2  ORF type:complete len:106 (+),score=4.20 GAFH01006384.1:1-318(+)
MFGWVIIAKGRVHLQGGELNGNLFGARPVLGEDCLLNLMVHEVHQNGIHGLRKLKIAHLERNPVIGSNGQQTLLFHGVVGVCPYFVLPSPERNCKKFWMWQREFC